MSISQGFTKLEAEALFSNRQFPQVDQLADILFSDFEQAVKLEAAHESIISAWITSSIQNSKLTKKVNLPIAIHPFSLKAYQALSPETQDALMQRKHTWLYLHNGILIRANKKNQEKLNHIQQGDLHHLLKHQSSLTFPALSFEHQCKLVKNFLGKFYHPTEVSIPAHSLERALYWQSLYSRKQDVFSQTIKLIRRAVNRLIVTQTEVGQVTLLEPHHIAEVLSDWEQIALAEILRPTHDPEGMSQYLNNQVMAQSSAIQKVVINAQQRRAFILSGSGYCGRRTLAKHYAKFINGHERFCIEIDFRWLDHSKPWHSILVKSPSANGEYLLLKDLVTHYPRAVFLLTHVQQQLNICSQQLQDFMRCAQLGTTVIDGISYDFSHITWFILFNTEINKSRQPVSTLDTQEKSELDIALEKQELELRAETDDHTDSDSDFGLAGLEEILYQKTAVQQHVEEKNHLEQQSLSQTAQVFDVLPDYIKNVAENLNFTPLSNETKQQIIAKALKSTIRCLRIKWKFPLYFQEEVIQYLFNIINASEDGLTKLSTLLHEKVCAVFQHALKTCRINDKQAFMLQLSESGLLLIATVVEQPSILQNQRIMDFGHQKTEYE